MVDTNVIVAASIEDHVHHSASMSLLDAIGRNDALIAAHSLAESYSTLTRASGPARFAGPMAWASILAATVDLSIVALTAPQLVEAVRRFSTLGIGPRFYDYLIGRTGEAYGAHTIVTWNVKDFAPLFPQLEIVAPDAFQPTPPQP